MSKYVKSIIKATIILLALMLLFSCSHSSDFYKQNLSDQIQYIEVSSDYTFRDIMTKRPEFKKLESDDLSHMARLLNDKNNLIWLKIEFTIDEQLNSKPLGVFAGHLRSASELYLNGNMIRRYGSFPPVENSTGYMSEFFMFPNSIVNRDGVNTIYIRMWTGPYGSISKNFFLANQEYIFPLSEKTSFFNSRITITFMFITLLIAFLYFVLYFILRKFKENRMYLIYALLNLYTAHFLLAFCSSELAWMKPDWISYLTVMKLTFCLGGFSTVYFAVSFILHYLGFEPTKKEMNIRVGMLFINIVLAFIIPSYHFFALAIPYLIGFSLLQFGFCLPQLFKSLFTKSSQKRTIDLLHGFSPVLISVPLDIIFKVVLKKEDWPYITLYCWQGTIYIFLWQLVRSFGNIYIRNTQLKDQLQEFNANLEEVVALRTKELSDTNYILQRGIETVSHVQKNFLPPASKNFRGWDLSILYEPLDNAVSGDLYDYYITNHNLDGLGIFDVSGHGIPAGLMTILAKGIISQHFLNGLNHDESISDILEEINDTYIRSKVNVENYITGLLFHFSDFNKNDICSVEFANAGHPYPLLFNAQENAVSELKCENPEKQYGIIGVEGLDVSFPPVSFRMGPGDIILCYTDGLTEALNDKREEFSKERVIKLLKENSNKSPEEIVVAIKSALQEFTENQPAADDLTIIVLKRNNSKDYLEEI